jgi:hypothetical protein
MHPSQGPRPGALPRRRSPQLGRLYRLKPRDIAEIEALLTRKVARPVSMSQQAAE